MKDFEPVRGQEELGAFPTLQPTPTEYAKLMNKGRNNNSAADTERMMKETAHSEVEKHATLANHFKKDTLARVLVLGSIIVSGVALGIGVGEARMIAAQASNSPLLAIKPLQSQLAQDTRRIAQLEDQLSQVKKSPTLQKEAFNACVAQNAKLYGSHGTDNTEGCKNG